MRNVNDFVKKMKIYGDHYHQLNGLYQIHNREDMRVPVSNKGAYKRGTWDLENFFEVLVKKDKVISPYLTVEFTVTNPTQIIVDAIKKVLQRFIESEKFKLFEIDLEKTITLYNSLLKSGIGEEYCSRRAVLRDNYILFMRAGVGLVNNKFAVMDCIKT
eukprot:augustus_masked-scaffold_39-processed-gene-1.11-mRNA-1 protein AED:1.00 eAED:1.00 QI:0/-1/0/0/-1/1/1/0/158